MTIPERAIAGLGALRTEADELSASVVVNWSRSA